MQTRNTASGKRLCSKAPYGSLIPLTQDTLDAQCTGLGGGELDDDWDVLLACRKEAHVYGPSLSRQDDWNAKCGTIAGIAHTQEYLLLHLAMFPIGLHAWSNVLGMPTAHQLQAQIIYRAKKVLEFGPITPAHRKPPFFKDFHLLFEPIGPRGKI